jgi:hypothetical protein
MTVRAQIPGRLRDGIEIQIPTPRRTMIRTRVSTRAFANNARQATHLEAVVAVASLLEPAAIEGALALVLETCDDAAEAFDTPETVDRSDALTFLAAAVRGEIDPS